LLKECRSTLRSPRRGRRLGWTSGAHAHVSIGGGLAFALAPPECGLATHVRAFGRLSCQIRCARLLAPARNSSGTGRPGRSFARAPCENPLADICRGLADSFKSGKEVRSLFFAERTSPQVLSWLSGLPAKFAAHACSDIQARPLVARAPCENPLADICRGLADSLTFGKEARSLFFAERTSLEVLSWPLSQADQIQPWQTPRQTFCPSQDPAGDL